MQIGRQGLVKKPGKHHIAAAIVAQATGAQISHGTANPIRPVLTAGTVFEHVGQTAALDDLCHELGRLQEGVRQTGFFEPGP